MDVQSSQVVAGPELSAHLPNAHCVHCEFAAVVQVNPPVQPATAEQSGQVAARTPRAPLWR
jgi:hypothetical protein